jgi:hypothetical protein
MLLEKLVLSKGQNEFFAVAHFISPYILMALSLFRGWISLNFMPEPISTTDLCDQFTRRAQSDFAVLSPMFRHFGGCKAFSGPVRTVRCFEGNSLTRAVLEEPRWVDTAQGSVPKYWWWTAV